ncbi:MAG: S-adenosylmethionine tRNA ribosyltransferase [Bacteroidetes bacterium]|nr:MAG: S-adenosylmethionine tRNA ribosyltransferase [Bacteroidota bacterium]
MDPRKLSIQDFTYSLPEDFIAKFPLEARDASKLLIYQNGNISEDIYRNIADHLPENSLLIFNDTKVIEARIIFKKDSGGLIEVFCLDPHSQYSDITTAMLQKQHVRWKCMIGGAGKWKRGMQLEKKVSANGTAINLRAAITERLSDSFIVDLSWEPANLSFAEILHLTGDVPLPPYLKRKVESIDRDRYQTIFAQYDGSVAAPTAGLHFTQEIFQSLRKKNIAQAFVTLHVGAGTFKPVKADFMEGHEMHAEFIDVKIEFIEKLINHKNEIFCVGTTSLRTTESLFWIGVKIFLNNDLDADNLALTQWEVYDDLHKHQVSVEQSLSSILNWMKKNNVDHLVTKTQLMIAPGYRARIATGLITNFHQPQSTLLLLVAALLGDGWRKVYDYALSHHFRFLSYGDGCLFFIGSRETRE